MLSLPFRFRTLATAILAVTSAALIILPLGTHAPRAYAAEGTIIIEQETTEKDLAGNDVLGMFGLATPVGVIEGESKAFRTEKPAGNYALTITPPAGALSMIDVYNGETLTKTFDARTATATLGSGETLKFVIRYDFSLIGTVSVLSKPSGLRATLRGPRGAQEIMTPFTAANVPEGNYVVTYILPKGCRPIAPIARNLETKGRLTFEHQSACPLLQEETPPPEPEPEEPEPTPAPPPRQREQAPVRVSVSSASAEVAAGASARLTVRVLNRGAVALTNLTVDYRYDGSRAAAQGVRGGTESAGTIQWTIPSLAPGAKWEESFGLRVAENAPNGTPITSAATVTGEALEDVRTSERSANARITVLRALPPTGVPLDLLVFGVSILAASGIAAGFGLWRRA